MKPELESKQALDPNIPFDWADAGKLLGASARQIAFALAKSKGANNTKAAKAAGYSGTDEQLRQVGYRVFRAEKVKALLKWAEAEGEGIGEVPCSGEELRRILSRHARGKDKGASIRAAEVLHRLEQREDELAREEEAQGDPRLTLDKIAEINPTYAMLLADHHQVDWVPKGVAELERCPHCDQLMAPRANGAGHPDGSGSDHEPAAVAEAR